MAEEPDGGTILIVDDDLRNIRVLDQMLERAGHNLLIARNGMEAMERAERGRPDVILLDIMMPGRDGYETCARLKSHPATSAIPVIFLSALGDSESVMKGFQAGGVDFVTKPFRQEEVRARVSVHLTIQRDQRQLRDLARRLEAEAKARKRTAAAAEESEARARALLDAIPDLVFRLNRRAEILDCRAEPAELIRHDLPQDCQQMLGKAMATLVPRFLADWFSEAVRRAMDEKKPRILEYTLSRAGQAGEEDDRYFEARVVPSGPGETIAMVRDITREKALERERRRMERRLETRRRLESLGVMAGGIAHDFNNILMAVLGNLELARLELPPEGRASRFLAESESGLFRAAELVRQMLAYSGKSQFSFSTVVPETWMRETRPLLEKTLPPHAKLEIDLPPNLPAISGDSEQLSQLLVNLAMNAAESYPAGAAAPIRIRLRSRTFVSSELFQTLSELWSAYEYPMAAGRFLVVEVSDDGEGMDAEVRKRMFEPFFSTKFQGRGLGLAVVLGIVRGHGGYLRVDSTPGRGAAVQLILPAETGRPENGTPGFESS
ncbi:MAG: response regulator [Desulfococcaceae bacterium]